MKNRRQCRSLAAFACATLACTPVDARAQVGVATGALTGRAILAATGEPLPFSLIALVAAESGTSGRSVLTAADGSFRIDSIAEGEYRLRLDRVGFAPELQPPVRVAAGQTRTTVLRSTPRRPVPAPPVAADTTCGAAEDVPRRPALATLWRQLAVAAEARRLFDREHAYTVTLRDLSWRAAGLGQERTTVQETPITHTPGEALAEELRASSPDAIWGMVEPGSGFRLLVPDLPDLFGHGFLETHCISGAVEASGERGLVFHPRYDRMATPRLSVSATILLDSAYAVARVELAYLLDGRALIRGAQAYGDPGFAGGQLRFASRLDLEEVPLLAGTAHWVGRTRYDNYRIAPDTAR